MPRVLRMPLFMPHSEEASYLGLSTSLIGISNGEDVLEREEKRREEKRRT
jgi:hypothetical protein